LRSSSPEKPEPESNKDGTDLNYEGGNLARLKDKIKPNEFEIVGETELKQDIPKQGETVNSDLGKP
jgi:hypothetical protein